MTCCLVSVGSNLGDSAKLLDDAVARLSAASGIFGVKPSSWCQTAPAGGPTGQRTFLNGAMAFDSNLSPGALLATMQRIEHQLGRTRHQRWDARTIDLDLLLFGDEIIESDALVVPHPRMLGRRFVLEPAVEIAPQMLHPRLGWTLSHTLEHLKSHPPVFGIAGWDESCLLNGLHSAVTQRLSQDGVSSAFSLIPFRADSHCRLVFLLRGGTSSRLGTGLLSLRKMVYDAAKFPVMEVLAEPEDWLIEELAAGILASGETL